MLLHFIVQNRLTCYYLIIPTRIHNQSNHNKHIWVDENASTENTGEADSIQEGKQFISER